MTTGNKTEITTAEHHEEVPHARQAAADEHILTPRQAFVIHPKAVLWSVLLSTCIIMEGYDIVLIYSFFAQPAFARKYGSCSPNGDCQITASWQAGLGNAVGCGTIIGAFANGYFCHKFGYRPVLLTSLASICAFIAISFSAPNLPVLLVGQFLCGIPWVKYTDLSLGPSLTFTGRFCDHGTSIRKRDLSHGLARLSCRIRQPLLGFRPAHFCWRTISILRWHHAMVVPHPLRNTVGMAYSIVSDTVFRS